MKEINFRNAFDFKNYLQPILSMNLGSYKKELLNLVFQKSLHIVKVTTLMVKNTGP